MLRSVFFFSSRRRHTRWPRDWSSDVCSSDLSSVELLFSGSPRSWSLTMANSPGVTLTTGRSSRIVITTLRMVPGRSEEHTSELQSRGHLVCRLLLEKKKQQDRRSTDDTHTSI